MSTNPQNQNPNWNQPSHNQNFQSAPAGSQANAGSFQQGSRSAQEVPPFVPGGIIMTPQGPVVTRAIKHMTIARRGWSIAAFILVALSGIGTFLIMVFDAYYLPLALVSTLVLAIGAGVVHMLESILAELRRLG